MERPSIRGPFTWFIVVTHDHRTLDVFDPILDVEDGMIKIRPDSQPAKS
jgi:hypothetical protein